MTQSIDFTKIQSVNIVGAGVFGTSIAYQLKQLYHHIKITIYDSAPQLPNTDNSSYDTHRIVRADYGADLLYTTLALQCIDAWLQYNRLYHTIIYRHCGIVLLRKSNMVDDSYENLSYQLLKSLNQPVVLLTKQLLRDRYSYWSDTSTANTTNNTIQYSGYINYNAGWVDNGHAMTIRIQQLIDAGVQLKPNTQIIKLLMSNNDNRNVVGILDSNNQSYYSDLTVVACGTWTTQLLPELHGTLRSTAQPSVYYTIDSTQQHIYNSSNFPVVGHDLQQSGFYGFPLSADNYVKIGHHGPGIPSIQLQSSSNKYVYDVPSNIIQSFQLFVKQYMPHLHKYGTLVKSRICWYCDTIDGDWMISYHRDKSNLFIATGGSGHGFKFLPIIGPYFVDIMENKQIIHNGNYRWRYRLASEMTRYEKMKSDACRSDGMELVKLQANL